MQLCALHPAEAREPCYGTSIQLNTTNTTWSSPQWEDLFRVFQKMGFQDIVVQWSAVDRTSFEPCLQTLLDLAARYNMHVWIGLRSDSTWWESISMSTRFVEIYLWKLMNIQMALADRIIRNHGLHMAFSGIYLPIEIDDSTWLTEDKLMALTGVLHQFSERITHEHPGINIAMSGFSEGLATPEQVAVLWRRLIVAGKLSRVYFRDSVGVRVLEPEESILYFKALQATYPAGKTTIVAMLEPFTQRSEESVRSKAFAAKPAPADRLLRQVALTKDAGMKNISFYSALEYMSASGGEDAQKLCEAWLHEIHPDTAQEAAH
ncbi:MAG: DUF4434 domain-containing protein [Bilophila sp.]